MTTTRAGHIFISHGSENRDQANELAHFLEGRGLKAWIAPRDVRPGMDYSEQLQLAIEECGAFVVLVTDDSNKSPYVRVETEMAFSINKPIFPVRFADVKPAAGLALFLKIKHWTDAYGTERAGNMERLVRELQVVTGVEEPVAPAAPAAVVAAPQPAAPVAAPPPSPPPPPAPRPQAPAPAAAPVAKDEGVFADDDGKRALIGPNADDYIAGWRRMDETGSKVSWNLWAFIGNYFWLAYRKMWIPLGVGIAVIVVAELIAGISPVLRAVGWLMIIGFAVALGLFGTYLYRLHLRRVAASAKGASPDDLRARGGVSIPAAAVLAGILALILLLAFVAHSRAIGAG